MFRSVSVVIPAYNSQTTLPILVERLDQVLSKQVEAHEIIIVNDGSPDNTWSVICELSARFKTIKGICLSRNFGQQNALLCGIREATQDVIVTIDDDLQHTPEDIPLLLKEIESGFDVVYGVPIRDTQPLIRAFLGRLVKQSLKIATNIPMMEHASAFRAFNATIRDGGRFYQGPFVSVDVLLSWSTTKFSKVLIEHKPRAQGTSGYSFKKLLSHAVTMLTGFSVLPLHLVSIIGFVFTLFGLIVLAYVLIRYIINGGSVPGFPFLASSLAIFSGAQLFAIGIIGEYLARIHFNLMGRPIYVIESRTSTHEIK